MPQAGQARRPELLAPAGDGEALDAALVAGADAVYFGLTTLNARRRARNLRPEELAAAVQRVQAHSARAYLTLNIDLTERELGQAARLLEAAQQSGVNAVLVRDPALLLLRPLFPRLEFHFSTQAGAANCADVAAARDLGLARVVLARELSLEEIRAATAVPGIQTEVFVQGALCYCVSGRCLLSSWGGGHSGNRGLCTSPCRVPWRVGDSAPGQVLSMRDLSTVERLDELARAGVAALKIEGRMKSPAWVREAVSLYRRALDGAAPEHLAADAERLGAYTGRQMTSGYLDGKRSHLTGAAAGRGTDADAADQEEPAPEPSPEAKPARTFTLAISATTAGVHCRCSCAGQVREWDLPRTAIRRTAKASSAAELLADLASTGLQGFRLDPTAAAGDAELPLAPRTARAIHDHLSAFLHQRRREQAVATVRIELPAAVRQCLERSNPATANSRRLGDAPDRVRLSVEQAADFALRLPSLSLVVEGARAADVGGLLRAVAATRLVLALPPVIFADRLDEARDLISACRGTGLTIEANTWGGGRLARELDLPWESGPGLPVLNSLAARSLQAWGATGVTLSVEANQRQLVDLCSACPAPASLLVYGRPALMITRADVPASCLGRVLADRRGIRMIPRLESGLAVYRPVDPFSIRHCFEPAIRVAHLVVDLVAASDPVQEWQALSRPSEALFTFNYGRELS